MNRLLRSLLFVPGDSERKQERAALTAADAVILDLEDSVAVSQLSGARTVVQARLSSPARRQTKPQMWVRVNAPSSGQFADDLAAVFAGAPDGLVLPKVSCVEEVIEVSQLLAGLEVRQGRTAGATRLIVIATETPQGVLNLPRFAAALQRDPAALARIAALTWGAEDLSAALGATGKLDEHGALTSTFQLARSLTLLTAASLGVPALDGVHADFRDGEGLQAAASAARRDGFGGKLAIHPDQIETINCAFSPTPAELARARRIVAAFAASPQSGVLNLDGQMIDRPHLLQARRLLSGGLHAEPDGPES